MKPLPEQAWNLDNTELGEHFSTMLGMCTAIQDCHTPFEMLSIALSILQRVFPASTLAATELPPCTVESELDWPNDLSQPQRLDLHQWLEDLASNPANTPPSDSPPHHETLDPNNDRAAFAVMIAPTATSSCRWLLTLSGSLASLSANDRAFLLLAAARLSAELRRIFVVHDSEERLNQLRQITNGAGMGTWQAVAGSRELIFSPEAARLVRDLVPNVPIHLTTLLRHTMPAERSSLRQQAEAMLDGDDSKPFEYWYQDPSGELRYFKIQGTRAEATWQNPAIVYGAFTEITHRRRAEHALSVRQHHSNVLLEMSRQLTDALTKRDAVHAAYTAITTVTNYRTVGAYLVNEQRTEAIQIGAFGTAGEILNNPNALVLRSEGDPFLQKLFSLEETSVIVDARHHPDTDKQLVALLGNRTMINLPLCFSRKQIGYLFVGSFNEEGVLPPSTVELEFLQGVARYLGPVVDRIRLTRQRDTTMKQLRHKQAELLEAQRIAHIGNWSHDLRTDTISWSDEFFRILGIERQPITTKLGWSFCHPDDLGILQAASERAAAGEAHQKQVFRIVRRDGEVRYVQNQWESSYDETGTEIFRLGTHQDITDLKQQQIENEVLLKQLQQAQKMEALGTLASGVAHDFNNILTAINASADLALQTLDQEEPNPAHLRSNLNMVLDTAKRASDLTRHLLMFSRQDEIKPKQIDLAQQLHEFRKILYRLIPENVTLVFEIDDSTPLIWGDKGQIEQCVMNLVVNARDAMPDGGEIRIALGCGFPVEPILSAAKPDRQDHAGYVCLSVTDTGTGIREELRNKIFDPFFTTKSESSGTGLGLSTVFGIVNRWKGEVELDSEEGIGSTFFLFFPIAEGDSLPADTVAPSLRALGGNETLLVVEDEESVRSMIVRILRNVGYTIIECANQSAALNHLEDSSKPVDLLLTDVLLDDGDGVTLAEVGRECRPGLPTVFMSGYARNDRINLWLDKTGDQFLAKPLHVQDLLFAVRNSLEAMTHGPAAV